MSLDYTNYQDVSLAQTWASGPVFTAWKRSFGLVKDGIVALAYEAVRAGMLQTCPDDALPFAAKDRRRVQGYAESNEAFRARLMTSFEDRQYVGTDLGIANELAPHSVTATVLKVEDWTVPPQGLQTWNVFGLLTWAQHEARGDEWSTWIAGAWAWMWIVLTNVPGDWAGFGNWNVFGTNPWNYYVAQNWTWAGKVPSERVRAIVDVAKQWKQSHAWLVDIFVLLGHTRMWDFPTPVPNWNAFGLHTWSYWTGSGALFFGGD